MIIYLLISFIIIEIFLIIVVNFFKKNFQWLITEKDSFPLKDEKKLQKFFINSYSRTLGWELKKGSSGSETANNNKTFFKISKKGYRQDRNKFKASKVSVFGDSFAFCRYVNDDKTWQEFLGEKLKENVRNFGVGNYGLDQSYLKFKNTKLDTSTKTVVFNFVPHTMERLYSYWRHYSEFGNVHGFKPVYILKKNKLYLKKNILKRSHKIRDIKSKIKIIQKYDSFYDIRFKKRIFKFPYLVTYLKNFNLYSKVFFWLSLSFFSKKMGKNKKIFLLKAQQTIIKKNLYDANIMYRTKKYTDLIKKLIYEIKKFSDRKRLNIIFLVSPTIIDIQLFKKDIKYQTEFFSGIKGINLLNLTANFSKKKNYKNYFIDDKYAGHLSAKGNKFVAQELLKFMKSKNCI